MTRARGELPTEEELLLGIDRPTPEQEAETEKLAEEERELRRLFLVGLMQNPMFRAWLIGILDGWQTFANPFGVGPTGFPDPLATQFALGQKAAGWHLWEIFDDLAPEYASLMRREARGTAALGSKRD